MGKRVREGAESWEGPSSRNVKGRDEMRGSDGRTGVYRGGEGRKRERYARAGCVH